MNRTYIHAVCTAKYVTEGPNLKSQQNNSTLHNAWHSRKSLKFTDTVKHALSVKVKSASTGKITVHGSEFAQKINHEMASYTPLKTFAPKSW